VRGWLEFPNLYEVQHPKGPAAFQAISTAFRSYLEARDWVTIQKQESSRDSVSTVGSAPSPS